MVLLLPRHQDLPIRGTRRVRPNLHIRHGRQATSNAFEGIGPMQAAVLTHARQFADIFSREAATADAPQGAVGHSKIVGGVQLSSVPAVQHDRALRLAA